MIRRTRSLEEIERHYAREVLADRTYLDALAVFEALWRQALLLNPDFPGAGGRIWLPTSQWRAR